MTKLISYLKALYSQTSTLVFHAFDIIYTIAALTRKDIEPSPEIILLLFLIGVLWGNYRLFLEYKRDAVEISVSLPNFESSNKADIKINLKRIDESKINKKVQSSIQSLRNVYEKEKNKRATNYHFEMGWDFPEKYNKNYLTEIDDYENDYKSYLVHKERVKHRLIKFEPSIKNLSQFQLNHICLEFHIESPLKTPDIEELAILQAYDFEPTPPIKPNLNKSKSDQIADSISIQAPSNIFIDKSSEAYSNITGPFFDRKYIVYYKIDSLIPDYTENDFEPFYLWFDEIKSPHDVDLIINLYCAESSTVISRKIAIEVSFE